MTSAATAVSATRPNTMLGGEPSEAGDPEASDSARDGGASVASLVSCWVATTGLPTAELPGSDGSGGGPAAAGNTRKPKEPSTA